MAFNKMLSGTLGIGCGIMIIFVIFFCCLIGGCVFFISSAASRAESREKIKIDHITQPYINDK